LRRSVEEARLEPARSGLVPVTDGWFVVSVRDSAWLTNDTFGIGCVFEGGISALRENPELAGHKFSDIGLNLRVLQPGQASGMYHAESNQEDFLVSLASAWRSSKGRSGVSGAGTSCIARLAPSTSSCVPERLRA